MATCPKCGTRYGDNQRLCLHDGTVLDPDQPSELKPVGQVLDGKYRLDAFLSRGGMGTIYRATHVMLGRPVAVKLIKPELVTSPDIVRRFQREARAVTHLNHPNIVDVYDLGQTADGTLYIAMELVSGTSLNEIIRSWGPLAPERIVAILGQVASALSLAHRNNVIHRDLKPHNIMVSQDDEGRDVAKLLDFGIAKTFEIDAKTQVTVAGSTLGTPQYMSPEQAMGAEVDPRSDLYSLGIILYEMLIGEVPFSDPSTARVLVKHMSEAPVPPSSRRPDLHVSPALEAIALRCLEKDPAKRFQTASELGVTLQRVVIEPIDAQGATIPLGPPVASLAPGTVAGEATAAATTVGAAGASVAASSAAAASAHNAVQPPPGEPPMHAAPPPPLPPPVPGTRPTVPAAAPPSAAMSLQPRNRSILVPVAAIVVLIGLLGGVGYWAMTRSDGSVPPPDSTTSQAPAATPAMADPGKSEAPAPAPPATPTTPPTTPPTPPTSASSAIPAAPSTSNPSATATAPATSTGPAVSVAPTTSAATGVGRSASQAAPTQAPREAQIGPPPPPVAPRPPAIRGGQAASPTSARVEASVPPRVRGREPAQPNDDRPAPATPTVSFQCTGAPEVCLPLRSAVEDAAEREGLAVARGTAAPEIVLTAEVTIVDERRETQFGTSFAVKTYSVDFSGESRRFVQSVPMPPPKTFSADARFGRDRYMENARLAATDAIERVQQFWKKRVP